MLECHGLYLGRSLIAHLLQCVYDCRMQFSLIVREGVASVLLFNFHSRGLLVLLFGLSGFLVIEKLIFLVDCDWVHCCYSLAYLLYYITSSYRM